MSWDIGRQGMPEGFCESVAPSRQNPKSYLKGTAVKLRAYQKRREASRYKLAPMQPLPVNKKTEASFFPVMLWREHFRHRAFVSNY